MFTVTIWSKPCAFWVINLTGQDGSHMRLLMGLNGEHHLTVLKHKLRLKTSTLA